MPNECTISIADAEMHAGKHLDRRRKYFLWDFGHGHGPEVCFEAHHTTECSGCFEGGDYMGLAHNYPYDDKAQCYVGCGCEECGYTGKRAVRYPVPIREWKEE